MSGQNRDLTHALQQSKKMKYPGLLFEGTENAGLMLLTFYITFHSGKLISSFLHLKILLSKMESSIIATLDTPIWSGK